MRTTRPAPGGSLRPGIASAAPRGQCGATFQAGKGPVEPMLHSDFLAHLAERGALRDPQALDAGLRDRRPETRGEFDWVGLTKLTQSGFAEELATFYGCDRVNRGDLVASRFLGTELSPRFLRERRLFPYETPSGTLTLAVATPADGEAVRAVELALQRAVTIAVATADDIEAALVTRLEPEEPRLAGAPEAAAAADDDLDEQRATDLHVEPFSTGLQVRLRIDGLLKPIPAPPMSMAKGILSRLKIMAGLNITERRMPQDGRARVLMNGSEIDLRVATMPTMHGESAVVRLLRKGSGVVALDKLGLSRRGEAILRGVLNAPFGMIIVTGPTGSGKTTTLAASLAEINDASRKILTVEDPIEYQIPGINQTQVHPTIGLTFASALRSFLRQDPDVIMVGEMRDSETAHIGVHSALTGHLVLTTLHTNTAAGAIPRLIDLGVESFLLSSCVRAIIGQRLVRILCEHCKAPRAVTPVDLTGDHRYAALGFREGDVIHQPKGCEWCAFTGFRGRKGVFEVLEVTPEVRRGIGPKTDAIDLERVARDAGMATMTEDGIEKCRAGLTTVDE